MKIKGVILFFLLGFVACDKPDKTCFKTRGEVVLQERVLNGFSQINLMGHYNTTIVQDSSFWISLEGGKNVVSQIKSKVQEGILVVEDFNTCDWIRGYDNIPELVVYCPNLDTIVYGSSGNLYLNHWSKSFLDIEVWDGSGDIFLDGDIGFLDVRFHTGMSEMELSGNINRFRLYVSKGYVGGVRAKSTMVDKAEVFHFGINDLWLGISNKLFVETGFRGNVYYKGNPTTTTFGDGSGKLIRY